MQKPNVKEVQPPLSGDIRMQGTIDVLQSPNVCYRHWRDFTNLPSFMKHVQSVTLLEGNRSHWVVDGPGDTTIEWDAEMTEDLPDRKIIWRSVENAQMENAGSVLFAPLDGGRQTRISVDLTYHPPMGTVGNVLSHLFGESADQELADDLGRFKEAVERRG